MDDSPTQRVLADPAEAVTLNLPGPRIEFGRYELMRELGTGGMGVVWLAQDRALGAQVALKMLREEMTREPAALRELKGEVIINRSLSHPNIVKTFDFVTNGHSSAISMEYVEGTNLHRLKGKQAVGFFDVDEVTKWIAELCSAMDYAHRQHIVHRDIKPANLLIDQKGELKVGDFGIGRTLSESSIRLTRNASGTPPFMSPQQTMGERAQASDDIYAIGATVYDLLTGDPPFFRGAIREQALAKVAPPMSERRKELGRTGKPIPRDWERAVAAALSKEASGRPATASELRAMFEGKAKPSITVRTHRVRVWPAVAAGLAVTGLTLYGISKPGRAFIDRLIPAHALARSAPAKTSVVAPTTSAPVPAPAPVVALQPSPLEKFMASGAVSHDEGDLLRRALAGEQGDFERNLADRLVNQHTLTPALWRDYSGLVAPPNPTVEKLRPLLNGGIIREKEFAWLYDALSGGKGEPENALANRFVVASELTPAQWREQTGLYPKPPPDPIAEKLKPLATAGLITVDERQWLEGALRKQKGDDELALAQRLLDAKSVTLGQWRSRTHFSYAATAASLADMTQWGPALDLEIPGSPRVRLLRVDAGSFLRGTPEGELGRRSNEPIPAIVHIDRPFYLGVTEITQAEYTAIVARNPSYWRGHPDWPVDQVDWQSLTGPDGFLVRFNRVLGRLYGGNVVADLPTNDEWEYACRAGTTGSFYKEGTISDFQRDPVLDHLANYGRTDGDSPVAVGSYEPNAWGFYDMLGNVDEWCRDRYVRGGSWQSNAAGCRIGWRTQYNEDADTEPSFTVGFRLLLRPRIR